MQDRIYEKKKQTILRFIKKHGKVDHSFILNEVNIDYDTLMKIISELRSEGLLDPKLG
jgi:predicted transcriptional regulator